MAGGAAASGVIATASRSVSDPPCPATAATRVCPPGDTARATLARELGSIPVFVLGSETDLYCWGLATGKAVR